MPNCLFQFKQFDVWSHIGGFKVGTDAVLLGAWADVQDDSQIMEIGGGTGVVTLMLAQRSSSSIHVVELDKDAARQARFNFERSQFGSLEVTQDSIQEFAEESDQMFDHIVCNPPYFQFSSKPDSETLLKAKHTDTLEPRDLISSVGKILTPSGRLSMIIPSEAFSSWNGLARSIGLQSVRKLLIRPKLEFDVKRVLVEWKRGYSSACESSELSLEIGSAEDREYTNEFKDLMKDYFIKF